MIKHDKVVTHTFTLTLNQEEMLALDAIAGYNTDDFLKVFYQYLGKHYLQPNERGCKTLFDKVRKFHTQSALKG